jgi:hypothetical protein
MKNEKDISRGHLAVEAKWALGDSSRTTFREEGAYTSRAAVANFPLIQRNAYFKGVKINVQLLPWRLKSHLILNCSATHSG